MSRDPFDQMKRRNPVPDGQAPAAPMSVADRIVGGATVRRTGWPGWAVAGATAAFVLAVGGGMYWWLGGGDGGEVAATTSTGPTTATTVAPTTSQATAELVETDGVVYFFLDQVGEGWASGPYLVPVRAVFDVDATTTERERALELVGLAMTRLLEGVGDDATSVPAMSSAIPTGTELQGVALDEPTGIATVYLSSEFASGGGSLSMIGRVGQVVYTLTGIDGVDGVRFSVDDQPTTVFGGEGFTIGDPATREEFEGLLPAVMIESPSYGAEVGNPLIAFGSANVFEATVSVTLTDGDGLIIFEGFTTATCGTGCRGEWEISIPYAVDAPQLGSLIVWEVSAEDGRQTNVREHPVWLTPPDGTPSTTTMIDGGCSGNRVTTVGLVGQPGLPGAVEAKRAAIWAAAMGCDWETLRSLLGPGFSYTFGEDVDAIAYWQELEAIGDEPMRYLAELLNRPFGTIVAGEFTYYVWPSAFNEAGWQDVPQADIDALRPLYDDVDFAGFAQFGGYFGYRVSILEDGTWVAFVAGD